MEEAPEKQLKVGNSASSVGKSQKKGCYYTSIPRVVKCKGISGQELTSLNLDKVGIHKQLNVWSLKSNWDKKLPIMNSLALKFYILLFADLCNFFCIPSQTQLLETLLAKDYGGSEDMLLGELQFAFVVFLVLWKNIFSLYILLTFVESNVTFCNGADGPIARSISPMEVIS